MNVMATMDHSRPILKLIDDIERQRAKARASTGTNQKAFVDIKKRLARVTAENILIHHAACSVLTHVGKHKDVRVVDRLLEGVPIKQRKRLRNWFTEFGPLGFVGAKATYRPGAKTALGQAMHKPFWLFKI
jgi:hypothetical protein